VFVIGKLCYCLRLYCINFTIPKFVHASISVSHWNQTLSMSTTTSIRGAYIMMAAEQKMFSKSIHSNPDFFGAWLHSAMFILISIQWCQLFSFVYSSSHTSNSACFALLFLFTTNTHLCFIKLTNKVSVKDKHLTINPFLSTKEGKTKRKTSRT